MHANVISGFSTSHPVGAGYQFSMLAQAFSLANMGEPHEASERSFYLTHGYLHQIHLDGHLSVRFSIN